MMLRTKLVYFFVFFASEPAFADDLEKMIPIVTTAANALCGTVQQSGESTTIKGSGDVKAELSKLAKVLGNFGIDGKATFENDQYQGVLQAQLADALKEEKNCKITVFTSLMDKITQKLPSSLNKKHIDDIADLIDEGDQISVHFVNSNDVDILKKDYLGWDNKCARYLINNFDKSVSVRFRSANPLTVVLANHSIEGSGYWQILRGKMEVLKSIVSELNVTGK